MFVVTVNDTTFLFLSLVFFFNSFYFYLAMRVGMNKCVYLQRGQKWHQNYWDWSYRPWGTTQCGTWGPSCGPEESPGPLASKTAL